MDREINLIGEDTIYTDVANSANMNTGSFRNAYVYPPYDYRYGGYVVTKDTQYPRYSNDNNSRVNAWNWKTHKDQYSPLNENAEMSKEYRKYTADASGYPPNWFRHAVPPTQNQIYRDTLARIGI